jgi:hypothetical protein
MGKIFHLWAAACDRQTTEHMVIDQRARASTFNQTALEISFSAFYFAFAHLYETFQHI